jgi:hypothetical protein
MYSYDSLYILADAIKRAKATDPGEVVEALKKTDYTGVFMRTVYDSETHFSKVGKEYKVFGVAQFTNGELLLIWPPAYAQKAN